MENEIKNVEEVLKVDEVVELATPIVEASNSSLTTSRAVAGIVAVVAITAVATCVIKKIVNNKKGDIVEEEPIECDVIIDDAETEVVDDLEPTE